MYCIIFCSFCGYFTKISLFVKSFCKKYLVESEKLPNFASSKEKQEPFKKYQYEKISLQRKVGNR